jgi:hypothetical protein
MSLPAIPLMTMPRTAPLSRLTQFTLGQTADKIALAGGEWRSPVRMFRLDIYAVSETIPFLRVYDGKPWLY